MTIQKLKRHPFFVPGGLLIILLGGVAGFTSDQGRIEPGLRIAGIEVGGLTPSEAEQYLLQAGVGQPLPNLVFTYQGQRWEVPASQLGLSLDVAHSVREAYRTTRPGGRWERLKAQWRVRRYKPNLPLFVKYDEAAVRRCLSRLKEQIDQAPVPARLKLLEGDRLVVEPDRPGRALNIEATLQEVWARDRLPLAAAVPLQVDTTEAAWKAADLRPMNAILSRFTTDLAHGYYGAVRRNRTHNVRLAARKFDGTILGPGEVFSFNRWVGPRLARYGYRLAPIFTRLDGANEVRDEVGGGICQCATTVYNAALLANLQILERRPHSKIVHYAPAGRDATVYFGLSDLRFRNTLSHPVALFARVRGFKFTVTFVGYPEDKADVDLRVTRRGNSYHLIRTVKRNGVQIAQELVNRTIYTWREKPKPPPVKPPPAASPLRPQPGSGLPAPSAPSEGPPELPEEGAASSASAPPPSPPPDEPAGG